MEAKDIISDCRDYISTELWRKKQEIEGLENILEKIDLYLRENCKHKWVYDDIDSIHNIKNTVYCMKCKINLK